MKNKSFIPKQKAIKAAINYIKNNTSFDLAKDIIQELADIYVNEYFCDYVIPENGPIISKPKLITDENINRVTEGFISFCYDESDKGFLIPRPGSFDYKILKMVVLEYFRYRYFEHPH